MKANIIKDDAGQGEYVLFTGDVDKANPIDHLLELYVNSHMIIGVAAREAQGLIGNESAKNEAHIEMGRKAMREFSSKLSEIKSRFIPLYYTSLLDVEDKKKQISLLKGATITEDQLTALAIKAGELGFTYSRYRVEHKPNNFDASKFPHLFERKEDSSFNTIGQASASAGQMSQLLEQRKVIVATFFDRGDVWHCFFGTYRGFEGKENHKKNGIGQPHMHYISSKWGNITWEKVLQNIREGNYPSTSVHIDLLENDSPKTGGITEQPLSRITSSVPEAAWLGVSGSLYAHYYPATKNAAACKRYDSTLHLKAAWNKPNKQGKPYCPACVRQLESA